MTMRGSGGQFAAGQSGNPGGRPAVAKDLREKIRARGQELVDGLLEIALDRNETAKNRVTATRELLDRGYGKSPQPIDGDGEGGPAQLVVTWRAPQA